MTLVLRQRGLYELDVIDSELSLFLDTFNSQSYAGSGSIWYDLTNNFHIITLSDMNVNDNTIEFVGQESFLFSDEITVSGSKSMSIWLRSDRPLSDIDSWQIGFVGSENPAGPTFGLRYGANSSQDLAFFGNSTSYSGSVISNDNKWSSDDIWHNVVITMDSSFRVRGYVDGEQITWLRHSDSESVEFLTLPSDVSEEFASNSVGEWVEGWTHVDLGEIRVYNRVLSDQEISIIYNSRRVRYDR